MECRSKGTAWNVSGLVRQQGPSSYLLLLDFNRFNLFCWLLHSCGVTVVILTSILFWGHHHSSLSAVQDDKKVREGMLL